MNTRSKTRHGPGELAAAVGEAARNLLGSLRRMTIGVTSRALWQVIGHDLLDGTKETRDAEVFYGIGFWSRPKATDRAEALVAFKASGTGNPLIYATRNEDARRAIAKAINAGKGLDEGETAIFASGTGPIIHIKKDNTVEVRMPGGAAYSLSLKSDSVAVDNKYADHIHLDSSGGSTSGPLKTVIPNAPNPAFPTTDPVNPFLDIHGTPTTHPFHEGAGLDDAGIAGTDVLKSG